jgi:3-oxoadipate enol-lactonase
MIAPHPALDIAFDDVGSGLPVVFLHPFGFDRSYWAPQLGALVDHVRCIAVDLRGCGRSIVAPPYAMAQYAADVVGLLDALRIERAVFAGLSMGGYVAFALWRHHPRRVRGLILANTRAAADTEEVRARRRALIGAVRHGGSRAVADAHIGVLLGASTRAKNPSLVAGVHQMIARAPADGVIGALEAMSARPDAVPLLPTIDVPTLVIAGAEDAVVPLAEARGMHEGVPGSIFEPLAESGHLSNLERPAAFNHVTGEFLAQLAGE